MAAHSKEAGHDNHGERLNERERWLGERPAVPRMCLGQPVSHTLAACFLLPDVPAFIYATSCMRALLSHLSLSSLALAMA